MNTNAVGYLPLSALMAAITNYESSKASIKFMEVEDTANNYFEGTGKVMSLEEIFRNLIDVDDNDDLAIRYAAVSVSGSTKFNKSELSEDQIARHWIGKSADGKPFLRLVFQTLA